MQVFAFQNELKEIFNGYLNVKKKTKEIYKYLDIKKENAFILF